jgi:1-acyl-sn-glycerol-3-phosphate acyltransferase
MLASNHASHADTAVIFAALPRRLRKRVVAAAAQDYFFDNGFRQFISRVLFNTIPVPRKISVSADPLRHVVRALREGYGVVLYPEGTRSRTGELGPFRSGIGRLAAEFPDVPIIPVWLEGTGRVLPRQGLPIPRPVKVNVRFGEPLKSERAWLADKSTWKVMAGRVREAVVRLRLRPNQAAD